MQICQVTLPARGARLLIGSDGNCVLLSHVGPLYLLKTDTAGHPLFTTELRFPNLALSIGLIETTDSNYVTLVHCATAWNVFQYAKYDRTGNMLWKKGLTSFAYNNAAPYAICADNDGGGLIVGGGCNSSNMTTRFDVNGNIVWQYQYRDTALADCSAVGGAAVAGAATAAGALFTGDRGGGGVDRVRGRRV